MRRVTPTRQPIKTKGRGALSNREGRFARHTTELDAETACTDALDGEAPAAPRTELHVDNARTIIARNASPDLPFSQSINPYRGCEHGCVYCYARTTHAYLDLSPGRDFETQIYYKPNAVELLAAELARPDYLVSPIALGTNTDPYQPVERRLGLTRGILELLLELRHPLTIVTKSGAVLRDLDLLEKLAAHGLAAVYVSVTTLDDELKRRLEPRTAGPKERLHVLRELSAHGVPTGVMAAPMIPALNDHELEAILERAAECGARSAGYVLLRLPHEVKALFEEWLREHYPDRAEHVLSLIRQMHGGALYDSTFHNRQRGAGPFAQLLRARFERARRTHGLDRETSLNTSLFRRPAAPGGQLGLWS
ncbi:MAG TPA: PA0069 family radical SAM protein [Gammaproteobacteria bacterium]|nr:PA0069 family radical SAM protein [Gammaproteobacteria bacterium]